MSRASDKLRGYDGPNPFRESQARTFSDEKLIAEFFPTQIFVSLVNEQHEILLGTRGSGKTALLKMLSYSCFRRIDDPRLKALQKGRAFIGFYVPFHLELMDTIPIVGSYREYFQFSVNCSAALALLAEVGALLHDLHRGTKERLLKEMQIASLLAERWFPGPESHIASIGDLRRTIETCYRHEAPWPDGSRNTVPALAGSFLVPIKDALNSIAAELGLNPDTTHWIACIDEAEFIRQEFLECINTFLRSEKRPLVVKMATLPFLHSTTATVVPNVFIQPDGHDFNYRRIDMEPGSDDFVSFTNHLCSRRLGDTIAEANLEDFLGRVGADGPLDYYRAEVGKEEASDEQVLAEMIPCMSEERRSRYEEIKSKPERVRSEYLNKFRPVFYVRKMRILASEANRQPGWFAGARTVRLAADGNPRRFIQIMNDLFKVATERELSTKQQHRVLVDFAKESFNTVQALPESGPLLQDIVRSVGHLLSEKIHGITMVDSGCSFRVEEKILGDDRFQRAFKLGVGYSSIFSADSGVRDITPATVLRLSFLYGIHFWLPLRKGGPATLRSLRSQSLLDLDTLEPLTPSVSKRIVDELQLSLSFEGYSDACAEELEND